MTEFSCSNFKSSDFKDCADCDDVCEDYDVSDGCGSCSNWSPSEDILRDWVNCSEICRLHKEGN